jgi:uncharacterized membrane protein YdbT with pleckstrin-like domain
MIKYLNKSALYNTCIILQTALSVACDVLIYTAYLERGIEYVSTVVTFLLCITVLTFMLYVYNAVDLLMRDCSKEQAFFFF